MSWLRARADRPRSARHVKHRADAATVSPWATPRPGRRRAVGRPGHHACWRSSPAAGEAGVSEVAAEIDVHKSTAFRLLGALEGRGLVEQAEDRGKYRLGFGLIPLAGRRVRPARRHPAGPAGVRAARRRAGRDDQPGRAAAHWAVNVDQALGPADRLHAQLDRAAHAAALHVEREGAARAPAARPPGRAARRRRARSPRTPCPAADLDAELERCREPGLGRGRRGVRDRSQRPRRARPRPRRRGDRGPVRQRPRLPPRRGAPGGAGGAAGGRGGRDLATGWAGTATGREPSPEPARPPSRWNSGDVVLAGHQHAAVARTPG